MKKRRWRKIWLGFFAVILILICTGMIYEWAGARHDAKTYKPVGRMYEVNGRKMHLFTGGQGQPTVVFASGWGTANPFADFYPLYAGLEQQVNYAVYDRLGYGFSDSTDDKRDIDTITREIHELLQAASLKPPYVFVGHSLGSLETIRYAQLYPNEVQGIVLVDGGSPEYYASRKPFAFIPIVQRLLVRTGIARTLYHFDGFVNQLNDERNGLRLLPEALRSLDRKAALLKVGNTAMTSEIRMSRTNAKTILNGTKPLQVPITVLTSGYFGKRDKIWEQYEADLPSWSIKGKQIIVSDSEHYIHHYKPETVVAEILALAQSSERSE